MKQTEIPAPIPAVSPISMKDELDPPKLTRQVGCEGVEMPKFDFNWAHQYDDLPPINEYIDFSLPPRRLWIGTGAKEVAVKERAFNSVNKNPNVRSPLSEIVSVVD